MMPLARETHNATANVAGTLHGTRNAKFYVHISNIVSPSTECISSFASWEENICARYKRRAWLDHRHSVTNRLRYL